MAMRYAILTESGAVLIEQDGIVQTVDGEPAAVEASRNPTS
jgi:hypothetical protein